MYLMEGRKLLDAYVFNELLKIAKPIVTYSVEFLYFCLISNFCTYLELKCVCCSKSFCRKKDSEFDRKKEMEAMKEERELVFACYILNIYCSLALLIDQT